MNPTATSTPPVEQQIQSLFKGFEEIRALFRQTDERIEKERLEREKEREKERKGLDARLEKIARDSEKSFNKANELFTSQWGRLLESLVEGDLVKILNERGIPVKFTNRRNRGNHEGHNYEFDIFAVNGDEMVVVEVKTTLKPSDVKHFLEKLKHIKTWMPRLEGLTIYGAVAFLQEDAGAAAFAENKGLFTIRATGNSASITNPDSFKPRAY